MLTFIHFGLLLSNDYNSKSTTFLSNVKLEPYKYMVVQHIIASKANTQTTGQTRSCNILQNCESCWDCQVKFNSNSKGLFLRYHMYLQFQSLGQSQTAKSCPQLFRAWKTQIPKAPLNHCSPLRFSVWTILRKSTASKAYSLKNL